MFGNFYLNEIVFFRMRKNVLKKLNGHEDTIVLDKSVINDITFIKRFSSYKNRQAMGLPKLNIKYLSNK